MSNKRKAKKNQKRAAQSLAVYEKRFTEMRRDAMDRKATVLAETLTWPDREAVVAVGVLHCFDPDGRRISHVCDPEWLSMFHAAATLEQVSGTQGWVFQSDDNPNDFMAAGFAGNRIMPYAALGWVADPFDAGYSPSTLQDICLTIQDHGWDAFYHTMTDNRDES